MSLVTCPHCGKQMRSNSILGQTRCCGCHKTFIFDQKLKSAYNKEYCLRHVEEIQNYHKRYGQKHRQERNAASKRHYRRRKDLVKKEVFGKLGNKCKICGETEPACLTIHHINGDSDRKRLVATNSLERYRIYNTTTKEIALLCFNCHHKLHQGVIGLD